MIPVYLKTILLKVGAISLVIIASFFAGKYHQSVKYSEAELKKEISNEKASGEYKLEQEKITTKNVIVYVDKIVEKEKKIYVTKDKIIEMPIDSCPISSDIVGLLSETIDQVNDTTTTGNSDERARTVETDLKALLENYLENLKRFSMNREQLIALQQWVSDQIKLQESKN